MAVTIGQYPTAETLPDGLSNIVSCSVSTKKKMTEYFYLDPSTDTTLFGVSVGASTTDGKASAYGPLADMAVGISATVPTLAVTSIDRSYTAEAPDMVSVSWVVVPV